MAELSIRGASKAFGDTPVLRDVGLDVADGEFCVIVGPSGCGKSTLLRAIAGLEELDEGSIAIGGKAVDGLPPAKRGIAMVFQSYALWYWIGPAERGPSAEPSPAGRATSELGASALRPRTA